jgi:hypothetical protein
MRVEHIDVDPGQQETRDPSAADDAAADACRLVDPCDAALSASSV